MKIKFLLIFPLLLCSLKTVWAAPVPVDNFSTDQSGTSFVDGPNILGGERDVIANGAATFNASGGVAVMGLVSGISNFVLLDYDGDDNASTVAYLLGDIDFTGGGTNNAIFLKVTAVTGSVTVTAILATSAVGNTQVAVPVDSNGMVVLPFTSFSNPGSIPEQVNRLSIRFNFDEGESLTLDAIFVANDELFSDGFEAP